MNPYKTAREIADATQKEVALATGRSQGTVSRWEDGTLTPSADDLRAIIALGWSKGKDLTGVLLGDLPRKPRSAKPQVTA